MATDELMGVRVLVVEDEALIALDLEQLVTSAGAVLAGTAAGVPQALALIDAVGELDLALLDVNVGGQAVFPVADALVARGVPILFLSGYGPEILPERFRGAAMACKPCPSRTLLETAGSVAARKGPGHAAPPS